MYVFSVKNQKKFWNPLHIFFVFAFFPTIYIDLLESCYNEKKHISYDSYTAKIILENSGPGAACRRTTTCLQRKFAGLLSRSIAWNFPLETKNFRLCPELFCQNRKFLHKTATLSWRPEFSTRNRAIRGLLAATEMVQYKQFVRTMRFILGR
jgi:hypothetical protein